MYNYVHKTRSQQVHPSNAFDTNGIYWTRIEEMSVVNKGHTV